MFQAIENRSTDIKPTAGFTVEKFHNKSYNFVAIDMAGAGRLGLNFIPSVHQYVD